MAKINYNGREVSIYDLSNKELVSIFKDEGTDNETRELVIKTIIDQYERELCPKNGEGNEEVFAELFSRFVNGRMYDYKKVAQKMATEHRYLQQEMFKVCMAYFTELAKNYKKGWCDDRNRWSCKRAYEIVVDFLEYSLE